MLPSVDQANVWPKCFIVQRIVKPEILDTLPVNHPDAIQNRKDIQKFNWLMGNFRFLAQEISQMSTTPQKVLEIGAGGGELGRYLRQSSTARNIAHYTGLDLWPRPAEWPVDWDWISGDALTFEAYGDYDLIIANLVLHQFEEEYLGRLGKQLTHGGKSFLFSELTRSKLHLYQLPFAYLLGLNYVSRHDARVSIEAGFRQNELAQFLGITPDKYSITTSLGFLGQYRMKAKLKNK